ncbi:MAG: hypothetical protein FWE13_04910 [Firmicutes bacterium]|nr:hypothetical protein [Bacillota bacterium]
MNKEIKVIARRMTSVEKRVHGGSGGELFLPEFLVPQDLIILREYTLVFGLRKRKINIQDIVQVELRFYTRSSPSGRIIIKTQQGKKYKITSVSEVYFVLKRLLSKFDEFGFRYPKILYTGEKGIKLDILMYADWNYFETMLREVGEYPNSPFVTFLATQPTKNLRILKLNPKKKKSKL